MAEVSFGEWLRRQRKAAGFTQAQLALQISCSTSALKKIEAEERRPSVQILERLAEIFNIPKNERTTFLRFARGDWQASPSKVLEETPWRLRSVDPLLPTHEAQVSTANRPSAPPTGTVTFLYTDIEGSTQLWKQHRQAMAAAHARHDQILREAIESNNGYVFQVVGDAFCAAFPTVADAIRAAVKSQMELDAENWGEAPIRVRMGIHTGKAEVQQDGLYSGFITLSHVQRLMSVAHGGQVFLSFTAQELVQDELSEDVQLRDMGRRQMKDWSHPEHIFQLVVSGLRADFPPLSTPESFPHNLPIQLTSFIGRERELAEVKQLLSITRLFTLTGPGGTGKTRLALRLGQELLTSFDDGVWLVELAPLTDESLIAQTVASIFGLRELPSLPIINIITDYLRAKQLLLILDNCEHLVLACAKLTDHLLRSCPQLKIIVTSREALGIAGETAYRVPSLSLPDQAQVTRETAMQFESVQLFVERASAVKPRFNLMEENVSNVSQICHRLDGIPLAIELAAARIKVLSVDEIAARLDDRFSLLTVGSRTASPRHQTLRATIDWSYDLLAELERILFRRLSVFAGGFTLEAAEAVCSQGIKRSDILNLLGQLVDKSLIAVERADLTGETRYRLVETIRQYAIEKLIETNEAPAIHDQHLEFFVKLAEEAEPKVFSNKSGIWWKLDKDLNNFRAAMEWSTNSGKAVAALQITGSLAYFWFAHGLAGSEWHDHVQPALSRPEGMKRTLARAKALNGIGLSYWADMYPADARPELEEALSIGRELNDSWTIATALRNLGLHASIHGDYEGAQTLLEQSLQIWQEMGPEGSLGTSWTLIFLGEVALHQEQSERARSLLEKANTILREIGDHNFLAYSIRHLAQLAWREGNYENAIALCKESLTFNQEVGDHRGVIACLAGFANIAVGQGKLEHAARLMAAVENQLTLIGTRLLILDKIEYERNLALLRSKLVEKTLARFWEKGKAMTMQQAIEYALENIR